MDKKLSVLKELIKLARVDSEVREMEYRLMLSMAELLGVEKEHFDMLFDEYIEFTPPASEFDRILQFHRLVLVANVDLKVNSKEINQLKQCGIQLGLRPEAVDRVIQEMDKHENGMIPTQTMLQIFQTYHN